MSQQPALDACLQRFGRTTEWMGIFDLDEFVWPNQGTVVVVVVVVVVLHYCI
jgi:hypothetical protein